MESRVVNMSLSMVFDTRKNQYLIKHFITIQILYQFYSYDFYSALAVYGQLHKSA